MRPFRRFSFLLPALGLLGTLAGSAPSARGGEPSYRFTRLAQSRSENEVLGFPVINNRGQIAFSRETRTETEVFRLDGRRRTLIYRGPGSAFLGDLAIGDGGEVAFPISFGSRREAILRGNGRSLTRIAETRGGRFDSFTFSVSVNEKGVVAFGPDLVSGDEGVFLGRGGRLTPVFLASTGSLSGNPRPSVNDRGWVAFATYVNDGEGVFLWKSGTLQPILDTTSPDLYQVFSDVSLNHSGQVAFTATVDAPDDQPGPLTLFTGTEAGVTRVADSTGPFLSFTGNPCLNDRGQIAFVADLASEGSELNQAVFVAEGGTFRRVIATGDTLDGSQVLTVQLAEDRTLNNRGQLVFSAQLQDGRFALFRADPQP